MDKASVDGEAGGSTASTATGQAQATQSAQTPEDQGDRFDELGYEKAPEEQGQKTKEEPSKGSEEGKSASGYGDEPVGEAGVSATGYGEEPPAVDQDEPPKPDDKPGEESEDEGFQVADKGPLSDDDVKELKNFIDTHKVSKEVAEALVANKKAEVEKLNKFVEDQKASIERRQAEQRRAWHKELKDDPTFGGEHFAHNVKKVDKVVEEFLPNVKKKLTESKGMLPPYLMRDLATMANHLYSTDALVHGDAPNSNQNVPQEDDGTAFYNS